MNNRVSIHYCTGCKWLLRASWMAQELLSTFESDLAEVALCPANTETEQGRFQIYLNDQLIWCRKTDGGFPDMKTLKTRIRDKITPERNLGHLDKK